MLQFRPSESAIVHGLTELVTDDGIPVMTHSGIHFHQLTPQNNRSPSQNQLYKAGLNPSIRDGDGMWWRGSKRAQFRDRRLTGLLLLEGQLSPASLHAIPQSHPELGLLLHRHAFPSLLNVGQRRVGDGVGGRRGLGGSIGGSDGDSAAAEGRGLGSAHNGVAQRSRGLGAEHFGS